MTIANDLLHNGLELPYSCVLFENLDDFWLAIYDDREMRRKRKKSYVEKLGKNRVRSTKILNCSSEVD